MKAAIYVRVSTDEQAKEGYSIGAQQDRITKFIESQGWIISDFYIDDGYSAKDLNRPEIQRLIRDAKSGKFNVVVFYKLDRLVRSVRDLHELLQLFEDHKIAIRSTTEIFDTTTAIGKLFITIVAAIAEWERETIAERVIENMTKKATMGERNGGKAPFGYDIVDGKLAINENEAKMVKEIFRMYLNGSGLREIVLKFNHLDKGPKDIRNISRLLDNPVYRGALRWNKNSERDEIIHEGTHPAIVSSDTFEKVQKLRKVRTLEGKKATSPYVFSGVLRCARCGGALSGWYRKEKNTKNYICVSKKNKRTCDLPIISERSLTNTFLQMVSSDDPSQFLSLVQNMDIDARQEFEDHTETIKNIEKELSSIKTRRRNWLLALGNGTISQENYKEMTEEDNKLEAILKKQLEGISPKESDFDRDTLIEAIRQIPLLWRIANDLEKKSFVSDLFSTIYVDVPKYQKRWGQLAPVTITAVEIKE